MLALMNKREVVGFTGSRDGMTIDQEESVFELLEQRKDKIRYVVHGGCVGADKQFHDMCIRLKIPVHIMPCNLKDTQAKCEKAAKIYPERPPLSRNKKIVVAASVILAAPAQRGEILRSGTWSTIRYAKNAKKKLAIIYSDGCIQL